MPFYIVSCFLDGAIAESSLAAATANFPVVRLILLLLSYL
jgi:hypothetical protein